VSKIDKKGGLSSKTANIDSKIELFIHFSGIFNSENYSIIFFPRKFNSKIYSKFLIWLDSIQ